MYGLRMKTPTLEELQRDLPAALALVRAGESLTVTEGEAATPVVVLYPPPPVPPTGKRRLGSLKGRIIIKPGFKMTEEEFFNS